MASTSRPAGPRYRRRIFLGGSSLALALFAFGTPVYVNRIEDDLERRVPRALAAAGFSGVSAEFSGQDGALACTEPLSDPDAATDVAYDVWGVRAISLDRTCRVNVAPIVGDDESASAADASVPATQSDPTGDESSAAALPTIADAVAAEPRLAYLSTLLDEAGLTTQLADAGADPVTLFAPTDAAFEALPADVTARLRSDPELLRSVLGRHLAGGDLAAADLVTGPLAMLDDGMLDVEVGSEITVGGAGLVDTDVITGNGRLHLIDAVIVPNDLDVGEPAAAAAAEAVFEDGTVTFTGVVASELERTSLLAPSTFVLGADRVVDQLTVDPDTGLDTAARTRLGELTAALAANLVSGSVRYDGSSFSIAGIYTTDEARQIIEDVAASNDADTDLVPPPEATASDAAALEAELNAFVAANPIRFEPGSAVLAPDASAILDGVAARASTVSGIAIVVEGHTDTDGDPQRNLTLSQQRADVVRSALIERGLPADALTAEGFGIERPVLVNGVEDKDASRRVEFVITTS